jgi:hypothetical protein
MFNVYRAANLNLAATSSQESEGGLFHNKKYHLRPWAIELLILGSNNIGSI